jgi:hypothetical protein
VLIRRSVNRNRAECGALNLHRDLLIRPPLQHAAVRRLDAGIILAQSVQFAGLGRKVVQPFNCSP